MPLILFPVFVVGAWRWRILPSVVRLASLVVLGGPQSFVVWVIVERKGIHSFDEEFMGYWVVFLAYLLLLVVIYFKKEKRIVKRDLSDHLVDDQHP